MITGEPSMGTDAQDGQTSGGVPVTDDLVEQLAAEAETGYDVPTLRRHPRRSPARPPPRSFRSASIRSCAPRWLRELMRMP